MPDGRFVLDTNAVIFLTAWGNVIPLDLQKETIALRRTTKLKLPDCIIAASAIVQNAVLLTADTELLHLNKHGYKAKTW